jgi:hypothetical protein
MAARDDGLRAQAITGAALSDCDAAVRAEVLAAASGHILARAIHVASDLALADRFEDAPRPVEPLAAEVGAEPGALRRLLHFLARHGLFEEVEDGSFRMTARGAMLRSDAPAATADVIRSLGHPDVWEAFGKLREAVRSGTGVRAETDLYEVSGALPHEREFSRAMAGYHWTEPEAVAAHIDFSRFDSIVDVGGSGGALMAAILQRHPGPRGTIFDRPGLAAEALSNLGALGLQARCRFVGGDFFTAVPGGEGLYILSHVLHDWADADAIRILRRCRDAMGDGSRLIVIEAFVAPGGEGESEIPADLLLLANTAGRLRSVEEHTSLLASVGLRLCRVVACGPRLSAIESEAA